MSKANNIAHVKENWEPNPGAQKTPAASTSSFLPKFPLVACIAAAVAVFYIGHRANDHGFQMEFNTVSHKIIESFLHETHLKLHAIHDASITAASIVEGQLGHVRFAEIFEERTRELCNSAHIDMLKWHPLVEPGLAGATHSSNANEEMDATEQACQATEVRHRELHMKTVKENVPVISDAFVGDGDVTAILSYPVFEWKIDLSQRVIGTVAAEYRWGKFFSSGIEKLEGVVIVMENTCNQVYTYGMVNHEMQLLGEGDLHDEEFEAMMVPWDFSGFVKPGQVHTPGCAYMLRIYPSKDMRGVYTSSWPKTFVLGAIIPFLTLFLAFLAHDIYVTRRHHHLSKNLSRVNSIVASLFPAVVLDRVIEERAGVSSISELALGTSGDTSESPGDASESSPDSRFLTDYRVPYDKTPVVSAMPIFDSFPKCSVLFLDIAGFTAWSSERDPEQVFVLLENLFQKFDKLASRLDVFKVETIGDCYVAATGIPEPQEDHCLVIVRFAYECMVQNFHLTKALEASLGPGTADLTVRVGIHSGSVIAGVLRAEKVRFQLFGDTMNTASRMESTGKPGRIQLSQASADLLVAAGKGDWLEKRQDIVAVKGKGRMNTFWVKLSPKPYLEGGADLGRALFESGIWGDVSLEAFVGSPDSARERLIDWNTEVLLDLLRKVVANRNAIRRRNKVSVKPERNLDENKMMEYAQFVAKRSLVDHVSEVISFASFDPEVENECSTTVDLGPVVEEQARAYVTRCASLYNDVKFHNFEHCSHVVMSANKLLGRIISPSKGRFQNEEKNKMGGTKKSQEIHDLTFGISGDPMMHFAVVQSAMIHDLGHTGLSNKQLVRRNTATAIKYNGQSVAEQHSVFLAMDIFSDPAFAELRHTLLSDDQEETQRYYHMLVSAVLATDIAARDLQQIRKKRWDEAFEHERTGNDSARKSKAAYALDAFYLSELGRLDTHFRVLSGCAVVVWLSLILISYWATPSANIESLEGVEKHAAMIAFTILLASYFGQVLPHFLKEYKTGGGPTSGVVVAVLTTQTIALITDGLMGFGFKTPVMIDPMLGNRVHLLRWCEWTPLSFLIYFITDGIDVPDRAVGLRTKYFFAGCQGLSTFAGLLFPFASNSTVWLTLLFFSVILFLFLYPHIIYKRKVFRQLERGISAGDQEMYDRSKHALDFLESIGVTWGVLVVFFFLEGFGPMISPAWFNFTRLEGFGVVWTSIFDVMSKMRYMNHVMVIHTLLFDNGERAERQEAERLRMKRESDRKATILFEYIIQASDVAHCMQHWNIYQKWNRRLFEEMYDAFLCGDSDEDPRPGWYQGEIGPRPVRNNAIANESPEGEIGFFDFYIIPLAMKLEQSGVFGVSGCEYLRYARENRDEWEIKGKMITANMIAEYDSALHVCEQNEVLPRCA